MSVRITPADYRKDHFNGLPYRHLWPVDFAVGRLYPLIVFLHGVGECGIDNESQLWYPFFADDSSVFGGQSLTQYKCHVVAPQAQDDDRWVDIQDWSRDSVTFAEHPTRALASVLELIDSLVANGDVDRDRIYLMGLSMGAFGVYDLLVRQPDLFAAAVAICGGADLRVIDRLKKTPIKIYHGARDKVVPVELSRSLYAELKRSGGKVSYQEFEQVGHNVWENAFRDETLFPWLFTLLKRGHTT